MLSVQLSYLHFRNCLPVSGFTYNCKGHGVSQSIYIPASFQDFTDIIKADLL